MRLVLLKSYLNILSHLSVVEKQKNMSDSE